MRLRYVHLPDYGPLQDIEVVFAHNEHLPERDGTVNFVVGLNGSGKSSMIRAIYDVFRNLTREQLPGFPVTLIYDIKKPELEATVTFHRPQGPPSEAFLFAGEWICFSETHEWRSWVENFQRPEGNIYPEGDFVFGDKLKGDGNLRNWLPSRVLAYTSGDLIPWKALEEHTYPADSIESDLMIDSPDSLRADERPQGWTPEQEQFDQRTIVEGGDPAWDPPLGGMPSNDDFSNRCILLEPADAQLAAVALGIWEAARDLNDRSLEYDQNALRKKYRDQIDRKKEGTGARRFLNELDWLWPTHASFHFHSYAQHAFNPDAARCFWLLALSNAVVRHPLGEARAIVNLGTCSPVIPGDLAGDRELTEALKLLAEPMTGARCRAEALRRLFGGERDLHETLWDIFETLRTWRNHGILKDVNLTVKRVHRAGEGEWDPDESEEESKSAEPEGDDVVLTYSHFSDGERMLLSRMAFLLLLKGQENSLLLLDEPETHFNDSWKRQIIDLIDDNLLRDTSAHVLVSTHTSLALTDVFDSEITRLWKEGGITSINPLSQPTFGADPGRILLNVFNAPDVIGKRAAEFLRDQFDPEKWPPERKEELEKLIDEVGSGWPRAKLMDILDQIEASE
ncbi:MAG: AAA family ATPase [Verrucomicrobiales bacterium]|nr:AAA family ATPase [Verrucomicrobiales bacterium]